MSELKTMLVKLEIKDEKDRRELVFILASNGIRVWIE